MKYDELKKAAMDCLVKAFKGKATGTPVHVIQAAVTIAITPKPKS